ncbi:MAG: purine-nucleoside phosphorylase [Acidobacteria bacterium]|nr:MAG: purine-nucleoside phosphorylase [Acidobacteriota bacterium]
MSVPTYYDQVQAAAALIRSKAAIVPDIAVVLGSGLGDFASSLERATVIRYEDIPDWPAANVIGHDGRLVIGEVSGRPVAALSGRAHFYEGHTLRTVTFPTRVVGALGVRSLILTNAAGGINTSFAPGDLMVIDDHINLLGGNPLVGPNDDRLGVRFPDLTNLYSPRLRHLADEAAAADGLTLRHGIYVACHGPSYETPAEVRYLRTIGADAVGMSTVPEAIVARHMGVEVLGVSCITNLAAGVLPQPLNHDEVLETAKRARGKFVSLLNAVIARM